MANLDDSVQYVGTSPDTSQVPPNVPPPDRPLEGEDVPPPTMYAVPRPTSLAIPPRPTFNTTRLPLPVLSEANIDGYFLSLEFWFAASNVTDDQQKYLIVMSQIPPHRLVDLKTVIENTPRTEKYAYIKNRLLGQYTDSQQRRLKRVLSEMPLGDQKPSALYNMMARVAEGALTESALVDLWASRLPESIHTAVAASDGTVPSKLKLADAIFNSLDLRASAAINKVQQQTPAIEVPNIQTPPISGSSELIQLVQAISSLMRNPPRRQQKRNAPRQNPTPDNAPQPNQRTSRRQLQYPNNRQNQNQQPAEEENWDTTWPAPQPPTILSERRRSASIDRHENCWYHRTFANVATMCRPPCKFRE